MGAGGRWTRRRMPRVAAIGLVLLVMGVLPGTGGTAAAQTTDVEMAYGCEFPSGSQQVKVQVSVSLPTAGTVGQAVQPSESAITVTVPQAALADVTKLDAATVGATARLAVQVAQPGTSTATAWPDLIAAQTALPQEGDLTLAVSGTAPAMTPTAPGEAAFNAGRLDIELAPLKVDGNATDPASIPLACTPVIGYDTTIGRVAIADATGPDVRRQGPARDAAALRQAAVLAEGDDDICPPLPTGDLNEKFPPPPLPPGVTPVTVPDPSTIGCSRVEGLSNVKKLNGAASLGGIASIRQLQQSLDDPANFDRFEIISVSHLELRRSTLLTFGFVPVSATMEITQLGNMNIFTTTKVRDTIPPTPAPTIAQGEVSLRLTDARVNGVPLDLGPHCRSAGPAELTLHGSTGDDPPYRVTLGGRLTGEITIPPFSGCGVGEDLDPLLTASVSGPGNSVQVLQGPLCQPPSLGGVPDPQRPCPTVVFGYTVAPGGQWTAASDKFDVTAVRAVPSQAITCGSVVMKGSLRSGSGANPTPIGQVTDFSLGSCAGTRVPLNGPFTITPVDLPWKIDADSFDPATGIMRGHFEGMKLHFSTQGCSFDASDPQATPVTGNNLFAHDNSTHTFSSAPSSQHMSVSLSSVNGCTGLRFPLGDFGIRINSLNVTFDPPQTITQPR